MIKFFFSILHLPPSLSSYFVVEVVPAVPSPFVEMSQDGTIGKLYLHANEMYHYITDA